MKQNYKGTSKAARFFSGKGFYIALAVSLIAVGVAAWIGINSAINELENQTPTPPKGTETEDPWKIPDKTINKVESDVPTDKDNSTVVVEKPKPVETGFILPIKGDIIVEYSGDKMVKSKTLDDWILHTGVDIKAAVGTPVKSMSAGKVTEIKNDNLWGTCVTIEHEGGITSHYANLKSAVQVKLNQQVKMGDVIGTIGDGCEIESAEESHLHFGVKKAGAWIDPKTLIK